MKVANELLKKVWVEFILNRKNGNSGLIDVDELNGFVNVDNRLLSTGKLLLPSWIT